VTGQMLVDVRCVVNAETLDDASNRATCLAMDRSTHDLRRGTVADAVVLEANFEAREVRRG